MKRLDKLYLGTNTKMCKTRNDTVDYLKKLMALFSTLDQERLFPFVIPSFVSLEAAVSCAGKSGLKIGAQNMHWENSGQFTGEISPIMLRELGVEIAEIGHSERRHIMGETDEDEAKKVCAALSNDLTALLCIGETEDEKNCGIGKEILSIQLKKGLHHINEEQTVNLMVAYEPVWAIGVNGVPADGEYVDEMHGFVKSLLMELFPCNGADIPVLYGGSVNRENAPGLIARENVDGLFIGRSAWEAESFYRIACSVMPVFLKKRGFI